MLLLGQGLPFQVGEEDPDDEAGVSKHIAFHEVDRILRGIVRRRRTGQASLERGPVHFVGLDNQARVSSV